MPFEDPNSPEREVSSSSPVRPGGAVFRLELIRGGREDLRELFGDHPREAAEILVKALQTGPVKVESVGEGMFQFSLPPEIGEEEREQVAA